MSSSPNLTDIESALVTAVGSIAAGVGSYNYTVATTSISRVQREITAVPRTALPAVDIVFQGEDSVDSVGHRRCVATYLLTGYVSVTATSDAAAAVERRANNGRLRDDIKAALYGSAALHGQGGVATMVRLREYMDTAGVPAERDSRGAQGTLRMLVDVVYYEPFTLTPPTS